MVAASSIKTKIVVTVISLCLISIAILASFAYWYQMHQLRHGLHDQAKNEVSLFYTLLSANAEGLARAHSGLDRLDYLLRPFAAGNKKELFAAAEPIFREIRQNNSITHMYFIEPDGKVLLRVHKPEQAGDVLRRTTFLRAKATGRLASGMEMGQNFFSLRSVNPVFYDGRGIGYIEVAEEIDHVFTEMKLINGIEVSLFLTQSYLISQTTSVTGQRVGDFSILYPTQRQIALGLAAVVQPEMKEGLREPKVTIVNLGGRKYAVGVGPVRDAAGATVGVLLSHREVTSLFASMWGGVLSYLAILVAILLSSIFLLYLSLRKSVNLFQTLKDHMASVTTTWDLSKRLRVDTRDEIGELADEFNIMTEKLSILTRQQEQMLIQQSKMAAMGEMIGYIAHQWRQPLNILGLIVQELPIYYSQGEFSEEYLNAATAKATDQIRHMSETVEVFRNFFIPDKEKIPFRVRDVLDRTLTLIKADFSKHNISVELIAEDDPISEGYPNEYGQVILNILRNTSDVFLERQVTAPKVVIRISREGERSVLTISDNAGGIRAEIIDKVFEPYFTTKSPEKGTGLGLYMAKVIIEKNMGGKLVVRNTAEGAEFRMEV